MACENLSIPASQTLVRICHDSGMAGWLVWSRRRATVPSADFFFAG
jgi:hypothetical protein